MTSVKVSHYIDALAVSNLPFPPRSAIPRLPLAWTCKANLECDLYTLGSALWCVPDLCILEKNNHQSTFFAQGCVISTGNDPVSKDSLLLSKAGYFEVAETTTIPYCTIGNVSNFPPLLVSLW